MTQFLPQRSTRMPALHQRASARQRDVLRCVHRCRDPLNIAAALFTRAEASALLSSEASPATCLGVVTPLPLSESP